MHAQPYSFRRSILICSLAFFLAGLMGSQAAETKLENTTWVLTEMNGAAVGENVKGGALLKLDAGKTQASGRSFVNRYSGKYELKDQTLKFGRIMLTRMAGSPEEMTAEKNYLAMLRDVTGWRMTDGNLELLKEDKVVAKFQEKAGAAD